MTVQEKQLQQKMIHIGLDVLAQPTAVQDELQLHALPSHIKEEINHTDDNNSTLSSHSQ
jgi:hypothetical protein